MNKKTQKAYDAALKEIGEQGLKLNREEYYDYIDELISHLKCIEDCNKEEQEASGDDRS